MDRSLGRGPGNHLEDSDRPGVADGENPPQTRFAASARTPPVPPSTIVVTSWVLFKVTNSSATEALSCVFLPGARPASVPGGCVRGEQLGAQARPVATPSSHTRLGTWLWGPEVQMRWGEHVVLKSVPPIYSNQKK